MAVPASPMPNPVSCEQTLADSPAESELRFKSRAVLPGYAKYLREVGPAVKVILDSQGLDYDAQLSSRYGGAGDDISPAEALLERIGATITLSGRYVIFSTAKCNRPGVPLQGGHGAK